jgi:hypothetical protein
MLVDCDDPLTIPKVCSMLPAFVFQVHPVVRVEDAVRGELEVIAWRDGLKGKGCPIFTRPTKRDPIEVYFHWIELSQIRSQIFYAPRISKAPPIAAKLRFAHGTMTYTNVP